jgi:predicted aspartyl protease
MVFRNRFFQLALLSGITIGPIQAQDLPSVLPDAITAAGDSPVAPRDVVSADEDKSSRMTVPVMVNDKGPFQFVIDTGADRTVISSELASQLALKTADIVTMHTMNGVDKVRTVLVPKIQVSTVVATNIKAPALAVRHLGADGLLGIDTLRKQRVVMDFRVPSLAVYDSARTPEPRDEPDTIVVQAKSRFGQLIMVDADINGRKIYVVIDSGAGNSVGNSALRKLVSRGSGRINSVPIQLVGVTGESTPADYTVLKAVRIGGFTMRNAPIAFADAHPFKKFGLTDKPAMLLGMDILRLFDRVSVDFANRKIKFVLPDEAQLRLSLRGNSLELPN